MLAQRHDHLALGAGCLLLCLLVGALAAAPAVAQDETPITFRDIAREDGFGLDYAHHPSPRWQRVEAVTQQPTVSLEELSMSPLLPRGLPGVVVFDHDGDGDLDIYATNSAGSPNSLFSNQLVETGELGFVDVAEQAGLTVTNQDSTGACAGDIDNDGDKDLLVLGAPDTNQLYENLGDGTFTKITPGSGLSPVRYSSTTCSFGDANGDGLLDIAVANVFDLSTLAAIFAVPFDLNHPTELYINNGDNTFTDVSETSGIRVNAGLPPGSNGASWSISFVDYDQDGDQDIFTVEEQGEILPGKYGGVDRGYIHIFDNDGTGHFTDRTVEAGLTLFGAWMGATYADYNCDGHIDVFGSNFGDYGLTVGSTVPYELGDHTSRWLLGQPDGSFLDPGVGDLVATPFGWGASSFDYDNDGDFDIIFHGGMFAVTTEGSNPGTILNNPGCTAEFTWDRAASLSSGTPHVRRYVRGVATGDLNQDGYTDIVSVSSFDNPADANFQNYPATYGSPFDNEGSVVFNLLPLNESEFLPVGPEPLTGTLSVELNSGGNGNGWIEVTPLGTTGITSGGQVNRDGVGAVVRVTPGGSTDGQTVIRPVVAGSSHASQDSLAGIFGLGEASHAVVEVLWPGGVVNRLYGVAAGERIVFPEIPCSIDMPERGAYLECVMTSLDELEDEAVLDGPTRQRFQASALRAYWSARAKAR